MDLESASDRFSNLQILDTKNKNQNMEEMDTRRAWGEVVSDGFNNPSYNPKKSSGKKKHKRKESARRTVANSTNSYTTNDPENLSRWPSLACTNSESLDMEPSSYAQDSSHEIKSSIPNKRERNLSPLDNSRKDASLVSHHPRHSGSKLRKKEKEHFPQNMEEMNTGRAWGEVVSDGFNIPSYNPKKSSGRKKHKRKESARLTVANSTNSYTTNDPENLSRRSSLVCTNSESLDMEPSSHAQDSSQEIKSSIPNNCERNLSSLDNSRKDASLVSHHSRHSGSKWRKKEKEHFPQNMEEMDTGRAGGEVVSDGFNIPSYNPKKSSGRKKHKRKESARRTVANSTNSYTTNDPENLSRWPSLACTNSESLDMEPSSHAQDSSHEIKSSIPNKRERNLSPLDNSRKDASLVSHHPRHSGSKWRKKEKEHFPQNMEEMDTGRARGEVVSDGFNIPSYNPKKSSGRKKHKRKESASHTVGNSTNSCTTNDPENLSRRPSLACTNSEPLDMEPSSHAEDSSQEIKSSIPNKSKRNLNSLDITRKDASLVSHHLPHSGSNWRKKEKEHFPVIDESVASVKARDRGKRTVLGGVTLQLGASRTSIWQRKTETNGYISPCNASKNGISNVVDGKYLDTSVTGKQCTSHVSVYDQYGMEATDSQNISQPVPSKGIPRHKHFDAVQKSSGPRRIVQTDDISAYTMAHCNNHPKGDWDWKTGCELSEGAASYRTTIPDFEHIHADRTKAEVLLDHSFESDKQKGKAKSDFGRACSTPEREVALISDDESLRSPKDMCGRRPYDLTGKAPVYSLQERASDFKKGKDTYNCLSDQNCETATGYRDNINHVFDNQELTASHSISNASALQTTSMSESENLRCHRRQKLMKRERKNKSVHFNYHGCSSSTDDISEVSYHPSYGPFPNSKLTRGYDSRHHSTGFEPVIEIDELQSPELRCSFLPEQSCIVPVDSSARTSQVESDEILARKLQEQFYNELQSFSGTQVDASIAWSLQQDDARQSASMDRSSQFNNRDASMSHLYAYYAQLPRSTSHTRTPSASRRDNYGTEMDYETRMMAEVRRNFNSGTMGREMRHNLLEALEATFDYSNDMFTENVLQTSDFDGNDYETLLALDENNHSHLGASEIQINSLPQSTIQSDNIEEACAICLDPPSMGDVIRLLPCLHKFHKECIDTWLRKRSSCPVCKYDI